MSEKKRKTPLVGAVRVLNGLEWSEYPFQREFIATLKESVAARITLVSNPDEIIKLARCYEKLGRILLEIDQARYDRERAEREPNNVSS